MLVVVAVGLLAGGPAVMAQEPVMYFTAPFAFVLNDQEFPAGSYAVLTKAWNNPVVWIRSTDRKSVGVILTNGSRNKTTPDRSEIRFNRYGGTYFLAKLVLEGSDDARVLPKSKREREIELAAAAARPVTILAQH
jgi:hypothetical protein